MKKISLFCLFVAIISICMIAGCDNSKKEPAVGSDEKSTAQAEKEGKSRYGGVLKIGWTSTSAKFGDPTDLRGPGAIFMGYAVQGLIAITAKPNVYEPMLATSWELAEDRRSYTFKLRQGVKFHDGSSFNAHVVKWNHQRVIDSGRPILERVSSIEVIDDYTVKYNLSDWDSTVIYDFALSACFIISQAATEKNGVDWLETHLVGTGPFKLKDYKRSTYHIYERFDDYWVEGLPYLDGIECIMMTDPMTQLASLKKGEINALREVDMIMAEDIEALGGHNIESVAGGNMMMWYNNTDPESCWSDKRMREALEYAIDKDAICKALGKGYATPINEVLFGIHAAGDPETTPRKYDPEKAKQLVAEAGYPNGLKVSVFTVTKFYTDFVVALQNDLAKVGIELSINRLEPATWREKTFSIPLPSTLLYDRGRGGVARMLPTIKEDLATKAIFFPGVTRPDGWDELLNKALMEPDPKKMVDVVEEMERKAHGDVLFVPLWTAPDIIVTKDNVKWDKNIRGSIWFMGQAPASRLEYAWLD